MDLVEHLSPLSALILFAGGFLQGAVGFGYGMLCIPLLMVSGHALSESIVLVYDGVLIQLAVGLYRCRGSIRWGDVLPASLYRLAGLPVGIFGLTYLDASERDTARQVVGAVVLIALLLLIFFRPKPRERLHHGWTVLAFLTSGFSAGFVGMGGPPAVLYVMAHKWSTKESLGFFFALFALLLPFNLALLFYAFGSSVIEVFLAGLLYVPLVFIGSSLGTHFGLLLPKPVLKKIAYLILFCVAVSSIM